MCYKTAKADDVLTINYENLLKRVPLMDQKTVCLYFRVSLKRRSISGEWILGRFMERSNLFLLVADGKAVTSIIEGCLQLGQAEQVLHVFTMTAPPVSTPSHVDIMSRVTAASLQLG